MGFGAYVICNCYRTGKTRKPPYEEYAVLDEDGLYLHFPEEMWHDDQRDEELYRKEAEFDYWKRTACCHEHMDAINIGISGILGFRKTVISVGRIKKFPILSRYLPEFNGGWLPREYIKQAWNELKMFGRKNIKETRIDLHNVTKSIRSDSKNIGTPENLLKCSENYSSGLSEKKFIIKYRKSETDQHAIIFESAHFFHERISNSKFQFTDIETGKRIILPNWGVLFGAQNPSDKFEFKVSIYDTEIAEYHFDVIESLSELLKVAIDMDNPIHWT